MLASTKSHLVHRLILVFCALFIANPSFANKGSEAFSAELAEIEQDVPEDTLHTAQDLDKLIRFSILRREIYAKNSVDPQYQYLTLVANSKKLAVLPPRFPRILIRGTRSNLAGATKLITSLTVGTLATHLYAKSSGDSLLSGPNSIPSVIRAVDFKGMALLGTFIAVPVGAYYALDSWVRRTWDLESHWGYSFPGGKIVNDSQAKAAAQNVQLEMNSRFPSEIMFIVDKHLYKPVKKDLEKKYGYQLVYN